MRGTRWSGQRRIRQPVPVDVVLHRWGRVVQPPGPVGLYLLVEPETREEGFPPPPPGSLRIWQRRQGASDDDDDNWSVWITRESVGDWFGPGGYEVEEWLPEGLEPDWGVVAE